MGGRGASSGVRRTSLGDELKYAYSIKAVGIMEKDGRYKSANDWHEIEYAQSLGWKYVGHPADLIREMESKRKRKR